MPLLSFCTFQTVHPRKSLTIAFLAVVLLAAAVIQSQRPYYNWDMFPYMAIVLDDPAIPFATTHRDVYRTAEELLPPGDYQAISQRQPELMNDAAAFEDILKYFRIKPGYNAVVSLLHRMGFNLVAATYLPSTISYFVLGCMLLVWGMRVGPPLLAAVSTFSIMLSPLVLDLARYSSPDLLCAAVSLGGLVLVVGSSPRTGLALMTAAILFRPDALILLVPVALAQAYSGQIRWTVAGVFIFAGAGMTALILVDMTLILEFLLPTMPFGSNIPGQHYLPGLIQGLGSVLHSYTLVFMGLGVITLAIRRHALTDNGSLLVLAAISSMVVRYLLHPVIEDRFHLPAYLLIYLILVETVVEKLYPASSRT